MDFTSSFLLAMIILAGVFVFLYSLILIVGGKEINVLKRRWLPAGIGATTAWDSCLPLFRLKRSLNPEKK